MNERTKDLFKVTLVKQYDDNWKHNGNYKYSYFCNEIIDLNDEALDNFIQTTISSLRDQQKIILNLKNISIDSIENELEPKVFSLLKYNKIANIYELRRNLYRRYNGDVISSISGIGPVKGAKILDVLDSHEFPSNFYTARWK